MAWGQRTNNDLHKSSPKSALSVLDAWQYEMSLMSRNLSSFNRVIICYNSNLNCFKHSNRDTVQVFSHNGELSVLSILDLASYSKQLNKYLSSNIIQNKDKNTNEPIIHRYLSKTQTYHKPLEYCIFKGFIKKKRATWIQLHCFRERHALFIK